MFLCSCQPLFVLCSELASRCRKKEKLDSWYVVSLFQLILQSRGKEEQKQQQLVPSVRLVIHFMRCEILSMVLQDLDWQEELLYLYHFQAGRLLTLGPPLGSSSILLYLPIAIPVLNSIASLTSLSILFLLFQERKEALFASKDVLLVWFGQLLLRPISLVRSLLAPLFRLRFGLALRMVLHACQMDSLSFHLILSLASILSLEL